MRLLLASIGWLLAGVAGAAPPPHASRAELASWLQELRASGNATGAALPWQYSFRALEGRALEPLSVALVEAGYRIVFLGAVEGFAELRVARLELHTPRTLEQRNGELASLARAYGARYVGLDLP